jgi:serine/threonine protein kinase
VSKDNPSNRFSDVKLADFGETYHVALKQAKSTLPISASIWRSPEAQLQIDNGWNTATDIWSFGLCVSSPCPDLLLMRSVYSMNFQVISLIYGSGIHLITPSVSSDQKDNEFEVLKRQYMFFGPIPETYVDQVQGREDIKHLLLHLFEVTPADQLELFKRISKNEISKEDSTFLRKIMKWVWRDRPTVKQLLENGWFKDAADA